MGSESRGARLWHWLWDRALEGIWQAVILALLSGGSVSTIFRVLGNVNWLLVAAFGVLTFVVVFLVALLVDGLRRKNAQTSARPHALTVLDHTEDDTNGFFRIRVENRTGKVAEVGVSLTNIEPKIADVPLPLPLQITHHAQKIRVEIDNGSSQLFDLLLTDSQKMHLVGVSAQPVVPLQRYRFTVVASAPKADVAEHLKSDTKSFDFDPMPRAGRLDAVR